MVIFINFINNEINAIDEELAKNENVNVLYEIKNTKFGIEKYVPNIRNKNIQNENIPLKDEKSKVLNISDKWLNLKETIVDIIHLLRYFILQYPQV